MNKQINGFDDKTNDKNERRFDHSRVIFKLKGKRLKLAYTGKFKTREC